VRVPASEAAAADEVDDPVVDVAVEAEPTVISESLVVVPAVDSAADSVVPQLQLMAVVVDLAVLLLKLLMVVLHHTVVAVVVPDTEAAVVVLDMETHLPVVVEDNLGGKLSIDRRHCFRDFFWDRIQILDLGQGVNGALQKHSLFSLRFDFYHLFLFSILHQNCFSTLLATRFSDFLLHDSRLSRPLASTRVG
jgi:hypothetical protein